MKPYYSINTNRLLQKYFCIAVIARILRVYEYEGSHRTNTFALEVFLLLFYFVFGFFLHFFAMLLLICV